MALKIINKHTALINEGIIHPKITLLQSTHSHVNFVFLLNTKKLNKRFKY